MNYIKRELGWINKLFIVSVPFVFIVLCSLVCCSQMMNYELLCVIIQQRIVCGEYLILKTLNVSTKYQPSAASYQLSVFVLAYEGHTG